MHRRGKGGKNDRLDALALGQRLDRYVRANQKAFSIVRVPTVEGERERGCKSAGCKSCKSGQVFCRARGVA